jgi:hypothetical protein
VLVDQVLNEDDRVECGAFLLYLNLIFAAASGPAPTLLLSADIIDDWTDER